MKAYTKKAAGMKEGQMQETFRRHIQKDFITKSECEGEKVKHDFEVPIKYPGWQGKW